MQWQLLDSFQILIRIQLKANSQELGVLQDSGPIDQSNLITLYTVLACPQGSEDAEETSSTNWWVADDSLVDNMYHKKRFRLQILKN